MATTSTTPLEARDRARARARAATDLLWHVGAFLIVNAFLWLMDAVLGAPGIQWAWWITAVWGFALAFHVLAWLVEGRDMQGRLVRRYLAEDEDAPTG